MFSKLTLYTLLAGQTVSAGAMVIDVTKTITHYTTVHPHAPYTSTRFSYSPSGTAEESTSNQAPASSETVCPHATSSSKFPASFEFPGTMTASFDTASTTASSAMGIVVTPLTQITVSGHATYVPESAV
ncbi:hypothetical protein EJ03DRAFT_350871 [Teratosphaeria nubilosa]|uniref:Uncharacterized protein n=1 Tax=Teratosphaeria nubilosa TaxID=161662 RepID=A0A6G1LA62_9PEZI|nr:hypothetical protein EJ03DRAFT_350871 [Teratosphaeria nubilosa]